MKNNIILRNQNDLYSVSDELFEFHGRHSYKIFQNKIVNYKNLNRTLLNNCCVRFCEFNVSTFVDSTLQGTEFDSCVFLSTDFSNADINSCIFINCQFIKCKMNTSNISENSFNQSIFDNFICDTATLINNQFQNCKFKNFMPYDAIINSNDFIKCNFDNCKMLTSVYYSIFDKCKFHNFEIDSYNLGFQYGITKAQAKKMCIEHFEQQNYGFEKAYADLQKIYVERKMPIESHILSLIKRGNSFIPLEKLVIILIESLKLGYRINIEEIRFVRRILNYLYKSNKMPLYYFLFITEYISNQKLDILGFTYSDNVFDELLILCRNLYAIKMESTSIYTELSGLFLDALNCNLDLKIEFTFNHRPDFRLQQFLYLIGDVSWEDCYPANEYEGSWHEIFCVTLQTINHLASIITLLGFGTKITKKIIQLIKIHRNKKTQPKTNQTCNNCSEKIIISENTKHTTESVEMIVIDGCEKTYRTATTVVETHKTQIITSYDNNIRNIKFM